MNELVNELSGKVIRVVDKNYSIFMSDQEIHNSVQMRFKDHVSYKIIKNLNVSFWKNVYDSWCKDLSKDVNDAYDLSNHMKVSQTKRGKNKKSTINVKDFHARFSVLSTLRSPIKLKLWNCSHRHHFEKNVHRGSMIKVIMPEDCLILFSCGLVHCGTEMLQFYDVYMLLYKEN